MGECIEEDSDYADIWRMLENVFKIDPAEVLTSSSIKNL
jgi:hypothetical protein